MPHDWSSDVVACLKANGIRTVATVPDGGLTDLLVRCEADPELRVVTLGTEQEGVGLLLGLWLGGERGALFMQSSGTGNCINALSLPATTGTPCLMLVTMRGEGGERNPWQVPMGRGSRPAMEAMGVRCFSADGAEQVGARFAEAADHAFSQGAAAAVLVHQHIIGTKEFAK